MEARAFLEMAAGAIVLSEARKRQVPLSRFTDMWLVPCAAALMAYACADAYRMAR